MVVSVAGSPAPVPVGTKPAVTVVIPTRNRCRLLREAVESVLSQTLDPRLYEIIVVDNCSEDGTNKMIAELQAVSSCRLTYHRMKENRGPAASRNAGVRLAEGEIIAFTDSDCRVAADWLERGLVPFSGDDSVAFVSGPVLDKPDQPMRFFSIGGGALPGENPTYPTANIFYRKSLFLAMEGFDESVWVTDAFGTPLECSDTDMAWRAKSKGYTNVFLENLTVYHEVMVVTPLHWLWQNMRVLMIPELVRRHPEFRQKITWWGPFCLRDNLLFYGALAGVLLSIVLNPYFILMALPFVFKALKAIGFRLSPKRLFLLPAMFIFFTLRQTLICGCLIYGSIRSRTLVL